MALLYPTADTCNSVRSPHSYSQKTQPKQTACPNLHGLQILDSLSDDDAELYLVVPHERKVAGSKRPIGLLIGLETHHGHLLAVGVHGQLRAAVLLPQACLHSENTSVNYACKWIRADTDQSRTGVAPKPEE